MPIVYFFYPETADRSLESIEAMFSSRSPLYTKMEEAYRAQGDVLAVRHMSASNPPQVARKLSQERDQDSFEHFEKASNNV